MLMRLNISKHIYSNIAALKLQMRKNGDWHIVFPDIMGGKNGYRHRWKEALPVPIFSRLPAEKLCL